MNVNFGASCFDLAQTAVIAHRDVVTGADGPL